MLKHLQWDFCPNGQPSCGSNVEVPCFLQERGGHAGELPRAVDQLPGVGERDAPAAQQHHRGRRQGCQGARQGKAQQGQYLNDTARYRYLGIKSTSSTNRMYYEYFVRVQNCKVINAPILV